MNKHEMKAEIERLEKRLKMETKAVVYWTDQFKENRDEIVKLNEEIKWRQDGIEELEDEIDKKNEEIEHLNGVTENQKKMIERLSRQLTEKELYEKKMKEAEEQRRGLLTEYYDPRVDELVKWMCRLEAHIEAQENPYFF